MSRIIKSIVLALTIAAGITGPTVPTAQASNMAYYTVYVYSRTYYKWVPVYRTTCYESACDKADDYRDCGYQACVR